MDSTYQAIFDQPRPRQVRLSRRGRSWLLLLGGVLAGIEILLVVFLYSHWTVSSLPVLVRNHGAAFYAALLLPLLPLLYIRPLAHQQQLLENGEVAMASVKLRYKKMARGPFYVKYIFRDPEGTVIEGESLDSTALLREGSGMLVFYDADNQDDRIAQCAAYYEVVGPGVKSDYVSRIG